MYENIHMSNTKFDNKPEESSVTYVNILFLAKLNALKWALFLVGYKRLTIDAQ